jgi:hypothetical protein
MSLTLREENIFKVYGNIMRKISGPKRGNNKEGWGGVRKRGVSNCTLEGEREEETWGGG